jgi:uncharacterized protein involved in type VI secretion and phage assembly
MLDDDSLQLVHDERRADGLGGRWYGVFPALVTDVKDPAGQGRVKVTLPWAADGGDDRYEAWARVAIIGAGASRGGWWIPDKDDEVLLAFENGNPRRPYVVGGLWNGSDAPPQAMDGDGKNDLKVFCSRNAVKITLDDTQGEEKLILETPGGQKITLKDGAATVEIVDSSGNSVKLEASGITVTAASKLKIDAPMVEVSSSMVKLDAPMVKCSGVVKCETLIATSVVGTSYTPGAGNIW